MDPTLDRFRTALKFSLWAWALYWPGGGLLLLYGGLDPVSIAVTFLSLGGFALIFAAGGLQATSSRTMREFILERPIYLIAGLLLFILLATQYSIMEGVGLGLFACILLGGIGLAIVRLRQHVRASYEGSYLEGRADQALLMLCIAAAGAACVLFDALTPFGSTLPFSQGVVAIMNWLNLLYPPLVLLATRGLREPLRLRWRDAAPATVRKVRKPLATVKM